MINPLTEQLISAGYKKHKDYFKYIMFYQKRVDDDQGKKYFVNVYEYDFSNYPNYKDNPKVIYEVHLDFVDKQNEPIRIQFAASDNLNEIEERCEHLFNVLECQHYEYEEEYT